VHGCPGAVLTLALGLAFGARSLPAGASPAPSALPQAQPSEKDQRTAAQKKIDSQLLYEIYRLRGEAERKHVPPDPTGVKVDAKRRALVDVRAELTSALRKRIESLGGTIVDTSAQYQSIVAWIPLLQLERVAGQPSVRFIQPAPEATTVK
jgi:hypothetical protein